MKFLTNSIEGCLFNLMSCQPSNPYNCLMIRGISCSLIKHTNCLPIQFHKVPLKRQIREHRLILLATAPIILEEQRQAPRRVEAGALDGEFDDGGGLRNFEDLGRWFSGCAAEVEVWVIKEKF